METRDETTAPVQVVDRGDFSDGDVEKGSESGHVLKVKLIEFADGPDTGVSDKKHAVKQNPRLCLYTRQNKRRYHLMKWRTQVEEAFSSWKDQWIKHPRLIPPRKPT